MRCHLCGKELDDHGLDYGDQGDTLVFCETHHIEKGYNFYRVYTGTKNTTEFQIMRPCDRAFWILENFLGCIEKKMFDGIPDFKEGDAVVSLDRSIVDECQSQSQFMTVNAVFRAKGLLSTLFMVRIPRHQDVDREGFPVKFTSDCEKYYTCKDKKALETKIINYLHKLKKQYPNPLDMLK